MLKKMKVTTLQVAASQNGMLFLRLFIAAALIGASLIFPEVAFAGPSPGVGAG